MVSTGACGEDIGGVSGGVWSIVLTGGSSWHGIDYSKPYAADGDFEFTADWSYDDSGGYGIIQIGVQGADGQTIFPNSRTPTVSGSHSIGLPQ